MSFDLSGAFDVHVHSAPDVYPRIQDDVALVRAAAAAEMSGVVLKSHHTLTADRAALARQQVGIEVYGGLALNHGVGGLNPVAVETAIAFGARQIWLPTLHAAHCLAHGSHAMFRAEARKGRIGIRALDEQGRVVGELRAILELVRDADVALGTGHLAPEESLAVLREAREMGLRRLVVTHPLMAFTRFSREQMRAAIACGAVLEFDYLSCSPRWHDAVTPAETAAAIRAVGAAHCVLGTDGGQTFNPPPTEMLRAFGGALLAEGVAPDEVRRMLCDNPRRVICA